MKYLFINSVAGFGSTGRIILSTCEQLERQATPAASPMGGKRWIATSPP